MQTTALNATELHTESATPPERVLLLPAGEVTGRDGRQWKNSEPDAVVATFGALGRDLPIDVEHASELCAPKGQPAPAVGWITALENENGVIWGRVQWLDAGRELVGGRQYRYLSPVILYRASDSVITGLTSAALTNQPNLRLGALNHKTKGELNMENTYQLALNAVLGLPEHADHETALNAVNELQNSLASARADLTDLQKFVPRADYDKALKCAANAEQTLNEERAARLESEIEAEITAALEAGRITPATADYHRAACRQEGGLDRFREFVKAAPVIAPDSGLDKRTPESSTALNAEEQRVCALMGIDEAEYLKTEV